MSPSLKMLVEQLGGIYPATPGNETLKRFLAELKPEEATKLFTNAFTLYREAVDSEYERAIGAKSGGRINLSWENTRLGQIADVLLDWFHTTGVEIGIAVRAEAIESAISHDKCDPKTIMAYSGEYDGYYTFYTNVDWPDRRPRLHLGTISESGRMYLTTEPTGAFVTFDVRDVYLIGV